VVTALLLAAAPFLVAGGLWVSTTSGDADRRDDTGADRAAVARVPAVPVAGAASPTSRPLVRGVRPDTLVVPSLHVETAVSPISLEDGALTPPADPQTVGWWAQGARPGASSGSAVITGHTVHTGGGAFDDLESLAPGDDVVVRSDHGPLTYDVVRVQVLSKGELAHRNAQIFRQAGQPRLVLITCEDWDGTAYLSNVVVVARPSGR
jgi:LPXTG-site transpeptidase (sortase) family protein